MKLKDAIVKSLEEMGKITNLAEITNHITEKYYHDFAYTERPRANVSSALGNFKRSGDKRVLELHFIKNNYLYYLSKDKEKLFINVNETYLTKVKALKFCLLKNYILKNEIIFKNSEYYMCSDGIGFRNSYDVEKMSDENTINLCAFVGLEDVFNSSMIKHYISVLGNIAIILDKGAVGVFNLKDFKLSDDKLSDNMNAIKVYSKVDCKFSNEQKDDLYELVRKEIEETYKKHPELITLEMKRIIHNNYYQFKLQTILLKLKNKANIPELEKNEFEKNLMNNINAEIKEKSDAEIYEFWSKMIEDSRAKAHVIETTIKEVIIETTTETPDKEIPKIETSEEPKPTNMNETYFIIRNSDGDTTVRAVSKEQLLRDINDGEFGNVLSELPENSDTNYWGEDVLIIKGKMIVPKAEQVITKYSID